MREYAATALSLTVAVLATAAAAENRPAPQEIILGQSCALTGSAEALGTGMRDGIEAALAEVNAKGGIHGRKVRLISRDDGYEPKKAIENTRKLLNDDKVFCLIGEVGTATSQAVVPIVEESKVPFFGPFTGAEFLRNPFKKYVVNVRASYYQEMERLAAYLLDEKKFEKVACLYQNDGYGQAGLKGLRDALTKRSKKLVATGLYERNTIAVKSALLDIRAASPQAVVLVGAYKPCAEFIKLAKKVGMKDCVFCNISFVGTEALVKELARDGEGVVISQVVSYPWDESVTAVRSYLSAMKVAHPEAAAGFVSFEGYLVGRLFCMVAEGAKGELTREAFLAAVAETQTFDLGGVRLTFGSQDHQGMDEVFLTVIKDGRVAALQ